MKEQRPGWSAYFPSNTKEDVFEAIGRATQRARSSPMVPVLHVEAHGGESGIGPDEHQGLRWEELTQPLQQLNTATREALIYQSS